MPSVENNVIFQCEKNLAVVSNVKICSGHVFVMGNPIVSYETEKRNQQ
jgi:hypothetical protein